jgi:hypothetical protein
MAGKRLIGFPIPDTQHENPRGVGEGRLLVESRCGAVGRFGLSVAAQQRVIDATPEPRIVLTGADRAITLFNQLVSKRLREEEGASVATARAV